jgi:fumarate reductase iron-sulfur subunit
MTDKPAPSAAGVTPRQLHFHVLRHDPRDPASVPHTDVFELEEAAGMTLFIALNEIRERLDPSLAFDFVCRAGICGSCAMVINGRPGLACRTLTKDLPAEIRLAPLPVFELIADLSVNTGKWMRGMSELETWVHRSRSRTRTCGASRRGWTRSSPTRSTSWTAASSAAAALLRVAPRGCGPTSSAQWA